MSEPTLKQILEGAILAADTPLSVDQLSQLFTSDAPDRSTILNALEEISTDCQGRGFELKQVASGYRFRVRHELGEWVSRLWEERPPRYSRALLETLALIAYRQPITRGDIEEIRGVSVSTNIMRSLMEREWIRIVGHRDVPGRPAIYATTRNFLDYFNLKSLEELPTLSEIRDLDKVNEELDLAVDEIEIRSLDLITEGAGEAAEHTGGETGILDAAPLATQSGQEGEVDDDALFAEDLDSVSKRVKEIQQNIRAFVHEDAEDDPDEFADETVPEDSGDTGGQSDSTAAGDPEAEDASDQEPPVNRDDE